MADSSLPSNQRQILSQPSNPSWQKWSTTNPAAGRGSPPLEFTVQDREPCSQPQGGPAAWNPKMGKVGRN